MTSGVPTAAPPERAYPGLSTTPTDMAWECRLADGEWLRFDRVEPRIANTYAHRLRARGMQSVAHLGVVFARERRPSFWSLD